MYSVCYTHACEHTVTIETITEENGLSFNIKAELADR